MKDFKFLAIDPGTGKCGLAVLDSRGAIVEKRVADFSSVETAAAEMLAGNGDVSLAAVGGGTGADEVIRKMKTVPGFPERIEKVREKNTTLDARKIYEEENPRPWPLKIIPFGLLGLPEDMDAYAAVAIGRRFLEKMSR